MCVYAQKHRLLKSHSKGQRETALRLRLTPRLASFLYQAPLIHSLLLHQKSSDLSLIRICRAKGDTA